MYNEFGPFTCQKPTAEQLGMTPAQCAKLVQKEPYRLTNGAVYIGQWEQGLTFRAGLGKQVWPDGSLYEG
jgi:hypothetical protein